MAAKDKKVKKGGYSYEVGDWFEVNKNIYRIIAKNGNTYLFKRDVDNELRSIYTVNRRNIDILISVSFGFPINLDAIKMKFEGLYK